MRLLVPAVLALLAAPVAPAAAQQDFSTVQIKSEKLAEGVYMLTGAGGNLAVSVGKSGVFLIDDEFAPLTEKILAAIKNLSPEPVRVVLNTHYHFDHVGGNENLARAGALLVAQENVYKRMSTDQYLEAFKRTTPAAPEAARPVLTYADALTFHWNGDDVIVFHVAPAHTDGDSVVRFTRADVIHMGDLFFSGTYPFIDSSAGGRIDGMIAAADRVLAMADEKTRIVPGHGPLATRAELAAYRDMLVAVRDRIAKLKAAGKTREEIIAAKPTADFDAKLGGGFMKPEVWTGIVYDSMK